MATKAEKAAAKAKADAAAKAKADAEAAAAAGDPNAAALKASAEASEREAAEAAAKAEAEGGKAKPVLEVLNARGVHVRFYNASQSNDEWSYEEMAESYAKKIGGSVRKAA